MISNTTAVGGWGRGLASPQAIGLNATFTPHFWVFASLRIASHRFA